MSQKAPNSGKTRASSSRRGVDGGGSVACAADIGSILLGSALSVGVTRCRVPSRCGFLEQPHRPGVARDKSPAWGTIFGVQGEAGALSARSDGAHRFATADNAA